MKSALPVRSVLALNEGKFLREQNYLGQAKGYVYATTNFEIGSTDALHYHDVPHLSFLLKGGLLDKRKSYETERSSGDLMYFHQGEPHQSIYKIFPATIVTIEIDTWFSQESSVSELISERSIQNDQQAKFVMFKIYKELRIKDEFSPTSIELLLMSLFERRKAAIGHIRPVWVGKVVELLNDRWSDTVTLSDLAEASDTHPTTISKHFPRYFSCTIGEYRRRLKVERAIERMQRSGLSLTDIAYQCGFADQSHFTRTFKQITGFLPRQYQAL